MFVLFTEKINLSQEAVATARLDLIQLLYKLDDLDKASSEQITRELRSFLVHKSQHDKKDTPKKSKFFAPQGRGTFFG